jgi:hypothetical protein
MYTIFIILEFLFRYIHFVLFSGASTWKDQKQI